LFKYPTRLKLLQVKLGWVLGGESLDIAAVGFTDNYRTIWDVPLGLDCHSWSSQEPRTVG